MKARNAICLATLAAAAIACDSSSSSDPKTISRDALNPPSGLMTITGDKQIQLTWKTGNTEKEFQGYDIFAVKGTLASLGTPGYPKNLSATLAAGAQVPRCVDNTALFESSASRPRPPTAKATPRPRPAPRTRKRASPTTRRRRTRRRPRRSSPTS